ncbi:MAG TPA: response regulator transcription factor [Rudaea sp.]|jgi:DNA-binding response OmpR family regulator|nr:response regulator transcription factor [Rudaea sp.]
MTMRILLIEDQRDIAANIWDYLEHRGFVMDHTIDGASGLRMALDGDYDVIVLDLGLPKLDGLDLCRALRAAQRDTPVLMLTARDTLNDKLVGFAEGADDYVVKPFAMKEVEARIRALYRRGRRQQGQTLRLADLSLDPDMRVAERGGQRLALTHAGFTLLETLLRRAPNLVRHAELADALWGESGGDIATLHTHLSVLRSALDRPFGTRLLHTIHGFGYRLTDAPDA